MRNPQNNEPSTVLLPGAVSADFLRLGGASSVPLQSIERALKLIGIISLDEGLIFYSDKSEWHRGGAETYISDFEVTTLVDTIEHNYHIIAKAIVKWSPTPKQVAEQWLKRQERLNAFEVSTPLCYAYWEGVLFQQFIPFSLEEYFRSTQLQDKSRLTQTLIDIAKRVDYAGFQPSSFIHNLRTDGTNIFIVDVGEDLGHYSDEGCKSSSVCLTMKWLNDNYGENASDMELLGRI